MHLDRGRLGDNYNGQVLASQARNIPTRDISGRYAGRIRGFRGIIKNPQCRAGMVADDHKPATAVWHT